MYCNTYCSYIVNPGHASTHCCATATLGTPVANGGRVLGGTLAGSACTVCGSSDNTITNTNKKAHFLFMSHLLSYKFARLPTALGYLEKFAFVVWHSIFSSGEEAREPHIKRIRGLRADDDPTEKSGARRRIGVF